MKAKFVFKQDGTVVLETIAGVGGSACTKAAKELQSLLPGQVDPETVQKTHDYHKTTEGQKDIEIGG